MRHAQQENLITPEAVLSALQRRVGKANGITATNLVIYLTDRTSAADERRLREVVVQLRKQGHPVCATPGDGYFIAANDDELNETCHQLLGRSMTGLEQVAALKHKAMPDLAGQLGLDLANTQGETDEQSAES